MDFEPLPEHEAFRIALARAILRDPSLLIIEEPDAPEDIEGAKGLDAALVNVSVNRTLAILPNRLSTLRLLDRIFLFHDIRKYSLPPCLQPPAFRRN